MNGSFFASFVREKFPRCFVRAGREKRLLFVMDNDPSQVLNAAKLVSKTSMLSSTKFHQIHPRSPCLNSIENIFHIVRKMLEQEAIRLQIEHETFNDFKTRVMRCHTSHEKHAYTNQAKYCFKRCKNRILNVNSTSDVSET